MSIGPLVISHTVPSRGSWPQKTLNSLLKAQLKCQCGVNTLKGWGTILQHVLYVERTLCVLGPQCEEYMGLGSKGCKQK